MAKVVDVHMPQVFSLAEDYAAGRGGVPIIEPDAYQPLSYVHGDVCEPCWLTLTARWRLDSAWTDWGDYDALIVGVGEPGCSHGGAR